MYHLLPVIRHFSGHVGSLGTDGDHAGEQFQPKGWEALPPNHVKRGDQGVEGVGKEGEANNEARKARDFHRILTKSTSKRNVIH